MRLCDWLRHSHTTVSRQGAPRHVAVLGCTGRVQRAWRRDLKPSLSPPSPGFPSPPLGNTAHPLRLLLHHARHLAGCAPNFDSLCTSRPLCLFLFFFFFLSPHLSFRYYFSSSFLPFSLLASLKSYIISPLIYFLAFFLSPFIQLATLFSFPLFFSHVSHFLKKIIPPSPFTPLLPPPLQCVI